MSLDAYFYLLHLNLRCLVDNMSLDIYHFLFYRFCTSYCAKQRSGVKFCWKCSSPSQGNLSRVKKQALVVPKRLKPVLLQEKPKTRSFEDYMACKKKEQQSGSKFRPIKKVKVSPCDNKHRTNEKLWKWLVTNLGKAIAFSSSEGCWLCKDTE